MESTHFPVIYSLGGKGWDGALDHFSLSLSLLLKILVLSLCQPGSGRERHAIPNRGHWRTDLTKEQVTKVWAVVWETNQGQGRALELAIVASHSMCSPESQGEGTVPRAWRGPPKGTVAFARRMQPTCSHPARRL